MEETQEANQLARDAFASWQDEIKKNCYTQDKDYIHTLQFLNPDCFKILDAELQAFGALVPTKLEALVCENNLALNLPRLQAYNAIGERVDTIIHHPSYVQAGDIIYGSGLLKKMAKPGGLMECLSHLFLSSQTGEAGHNCPIACSAGIIRLLQKMPDFADKAFYLDKLTASSYQTNFTGAQFLTEIQGGSDVGLNASYAESDASKTWRIYGEKWFCSNAGANLIFATARFDESIPGTKGLGLFLIPARWKGNKNHYTIRRLKDKIGTRSMATGEIDFHGAHAIAIGLEHGFHLAMSNVLHLSRLFNSVCVLGMGRRAYTIAKAYAQHRIAFSHPIIDYPLVMENLARIKAENTAMIAAIFATISLQDHADTEGKEDKAAQLVLRLLVNIQKYLSARWSVDHIHHALDVLAGNGTIETFSPLPRLLRDCIVCENWEGTHNVLRAQVLKDILKYKVDELYLAFMKDKLARIKANTPQLPGLVLALDAFEQELIAFRQLDSNRQSLQIRLVVDRMAILYCAMALLMEVVDEQKMARSHSKTDCYHYFNLLHIQTKKITYDNGYLTLLSRMTRDE